MRKSGALFVAVLAVATLAGEVAAERAARVDAFAAADRVRALPAEAESTAFVKPGTVIQVEPRLGVPTFVWAAPRAVPFDARRPEEAARRYLAEFAPLYRLAPADASNATVRAVHDTGRGVIVVKLREEVEGIEVFREELSVALRRDLSLVSLSGYPSGAPARAGKGLAQTYRLSARPRSRRRTRETGGGGLCRRTFARATSTRPLRSLRSGGPGRVRDP
jgi:hypothetical protein